jgi:hypothetical protein
MDWDYWLGRKYAALDQNAAADTTRAQAGLDLGQRRREPRCGQGRPAAGPDHCGHRRGESAREPHQRQREARSRPRQGVRGGELRQRQGQLAQAGLFGAQTTAESISSNDSLGRIGMTTNPIIQSFWRSASA